MLEIKIKHPVEIVYYVHAYSETTFVTTENIDDVILKRLISNLIKNNGNVMKICYYVRFYSDTIVVTSKNPNSQGYNE